MTKSKHRSRFFLALASASLLTAGGVAACSSTSDDAGSFDAGLDGTTSGDAASSDGAKSGNDSGVIPPGSCPSQTLAGSCDLVLQNCEAGNECDPVQDNSGNFVATCEPAGGGTVPLGHECCQNGPNLGNCVAGLFCNATCAVLDGGPGTKSGRCSPYCCPGGTSTCGASDPEGIKGACGPAEVLTLDDGGTVQFGFGCTYPTSCKPFHVQPCTDPTAICTIQDDNVTFRCESLFETPGVDAGGDCHNIENACANGLECVGDLDASVCTYPCYQADQDGGPPPFDAAALPKTPGYGGCPAGQSCNTYVPGWPGWYGLCGP